MSLDNENINRNPNPVTQPLSQAAIHKAAKEAARQDMGVLIYYGVPSEHHTQEEKDMIQGMQGVSPMGKLIFPKADAADFNGEDF